MRLTFLMLAAVAALARAQDSRPSFEAVTLKLNTHGIGSSADSDRGQILMTNQSLKRLVERAYSVRPYQVVGPGWLENVHLDIAAKYPPNTRRADQPLMLRTLLEDRLKLAAHRESRQMPGYALVVTKSGFKLKPVEDTGTHINHHGGTEEVLNATTEMSPLADHLARVLGITVVNETGLAGAYRFEIHWRVVPPESGSAEDVETARVAALNEGLDAIGLRLRAQKVPVEVVVVDHMERAPVEN